MSGGYVFDWGRHKGEPIEDVPDDYVWWLALLERPTPVAARSVEVAQAEVARRVALEVAG